MAATGRIRLTLYLDRSRPKPRELVLPIAARNDTTFCGVQGGAGSQYWKTHMYGRIVPERKTPSHNPLYTSRFPVREGLWSSWKGRLSTAQRLGRATRMVPGHTWCLILRVTCKTSKTFEVLPQLRDHTAHPPRRSPQQTPASIEPWHQLEKNPRRPVDSTRALWSPKRRARATCTTEKRREEPLPERPPTSHLSRQYPKPPLQQRRWSSHGKQRAPLPPERAPPPWSGAPDG